MSNDKQEFNQAIPFFAHYLEGQIDFIEEISEAETQAVGGGFKALTRKYPSDQEDCKPIAITEKYPSDNEDICDGVPVTKKYPSDNEEIVTQKFPSDNEDGCGGGVAVTLKYPSDNDENVATLK